jgi:inward rectifier potassium channel
MTASWPSFIGGAMLVFVIFNAAFGLLYWIGDKPISNVTNGDYFDYLYFSIETLSTAGYGDMHPQTHYGHFVSAVELFTGVFSMSLMTGLIFARFSRPSARLLFANNPVVSNDEGQSTLKIRLANERHNMIGNATARLWLLKNVTTIEGHSVRRFSELALLKNEHPALALSWTLYHVLDESSELFNIDTENLKTNGATLVVVVSGYDVVAAQTIHARKSYDHTDILFGRRYADILDNLADGRIRIDYGKFHDTVAE